MKLNLKDVLKHSFVITIDDKRFNDFKAIFKYHKLSPMPKRFQGTTLWYNSGKYNCYLAHRNAILKAKKLNWPYVCVFENDAYPINGVVWEMQRCLDELPDECQVLSFGNIFMWDVQGECGNFWRSYKSYGSHAYVVFQSAYDRFIEMLDLGHEGDSAFYSISDDILPKDVFFMPKKNLFIQYSDSDGVNNNRGYVFLDPSKVYAKDGKLIVPYNKTIPEEKVVEMGFPRISDIFQERGRYSSEEKNMAIVTMRSPGHFRQSLVDLINATGPIDTMLEVGSYAGESADIFAASGKVKTLWCIDPWLPGYDENDKASSTDFVEVEAAFDKIVEKHPTVIHKFKGVLEGFIKEHPEVHPNLVYIDACHTYEGCKNDIINALKLNPKIISGHDYAHWCPGVIQAVDEVLGKPHKTFCDGSWIVRLSK